MDFEAEGQFSKYNLELADSEMLPRHFKDSEDQCERLIKANLPMPAYDECLKASHAFNQLKHLE